MRELLSLPRLRWVSILLPAGFIVAAELVIAPLLESVMSEVSAHLLTAAAMLGGIIAFSLAIFRVLGEKERTILAQARRSPALQQIGAEASGLLEPDRLIRLVVERARELIGADVAGFARAEADGSTLSWQHVAGGEAGAGLHPTRLRRGEGIAGYVAASGKGHELAAATAVLGTVPLAGRVVTANALLTRRARCEQIVGRDGDYVFPVDANQPSLRSEVEEAFSPVTAEVAEGRRAWQS